MPHLGHDFPQRLFTAITTAVSLFVLIAIFFILQYILDMDFVCSCKPGIHLNGVLYMVAPPVIITWVVYITEPYHQRSFFSTWHSLCPNNICSSIVKLLINYLSLSAVWIATVLFDGDWYFCLMTNLNSSQTGIPCKTNLTYEENRIKADYKTASLDIGFGVIIVLVLVWSIGEIARVYCIRKKTWKKGSRFEMLCPPYYRAVYEDLLAEQVSVHLKEELTKIAAERAEAICKTHLRAIGDEEQTSNNMCGGDDNVNSKLLEAWQHISASEFYLK